DQGFELLWRKAYPLIHTKPSRAHPLDGLGGSGHRSRPWLGPSAKRCPFPIGYADPRWDASRPARPAPPLCIRLLTLRALLLWRRPSSAASHLDRRRAVGQVHRVSHRNQHFARPLEALPAMRRADVVHKHQVTGLPLLACRVCVVDTVDQLHGVRVDRVTVSKARIERQSVLAVDVHEVLAHLRLHRPLAEECDLVEPAALAGTRVMHDSTAALPGAQGAVGAPLERDRTRAAVALDGATVVAAE